MLVQKALYIDDLVLFIYNYYDLVSNLLNPKKITQVHICKSRAVPGTYQGL